MTETLILVDEDGNPVGTGEKMSVHREGLLHRCFSIFIFNDKGQLLLQKRAQAKYHSGGLWTNTCCGHPQNGESIASAAHRRLVEEMGFDCALEEVFTFTYKARLDNEFFEHEFDHVLVGRYNDAVSPNPDEADGYEWEDVDFVITDMDTNPERYTVWSKIAFRKLLNGHGEKLSNP